MSRLLRQLILAVATLAVLSVLAMFTAREAIAQVRAAIIKDVDEPGRTPYVQHVVLSKPGNCGLNFCSGLLPVVPAGKRLVITRFHGMIALGPGAIANRVRLLRVIPGGGFPAPAFEVPHNPSAIYQDTLSLSSPFRYSFNHELLMFVEAGERPAIDFSTVGGNLNGEWPNEFTVSGYLVDLTV